MRFDWRALSGPALTATTALIAVSVDRYVMAIPDPAPLLVGMVALAGSLNGLAPGMISAVIAVGGCALFFLGHHVTPEPAASDLARLSLLATAVAGTAAITGLLRKKRIDMVAWERRHHATTARLSAALDEVDIGIVLLDSDTRAEFINRAFRRYFSFPDDKADGKPPFIALMYHGRDTGAYELPAEELDAFIARRTAMMRAGNSTPINIKLANKQVLRFSCTALPDGGRMLSYTPVTDLVRSTDDPAKAEYYRSLRRGGDSDRGRLDAAE